MARLFILIVGIWFLWANSTLAQQSDLRSIAGKKYPNDISEGTNPISIDAWTLDLQPNEAAPGFSELLEYAMASPDQEEAGSCLYMSLTGMAEWWLARLNPRASRALEGPLDLSERFLMNVAGDDETTPGFKNWKTDSIYHFNRAKTALRNRDYRFTKGWYTTDENGSYVSARPNSRDATYDTAYNWIYDLDSAPSSGRIKLPVFEREVLFADPASNQWNVGVMPETIIDTIKAKMRERKAPVQIIYNHFGYWHAANIVGFDDEADTKNCSFVRRFITYMKDRPEELRKEAAETDDPAEKKRLLNAARRAEEAYQKIQAPWQRGGCQAKGMFYVRDSIYGDKSEPLYDYDLSQKGEESNYSKRIIMHEYEWVKYMANHATQIYVR